MKKISFLIAMITLLFMLGLLILPTGYAADKEYVMKGKITAIEEQYNTVVIDVPMGKTYFTVGGPLIPNAVLRKKGQKAKLSDFKVGDTVTVRWKAAPSGHMIERLEER